MHAHDTLRQGVQETQETQKDPEFPYGDEKGRRRFQIYLFIGRWDFYCKRRIQGVERYGLPEGNHRQYE